MTRNVTQAEMRHDVAPRLNRLPQRLDYTLIPAPLGKFAQELPISLSDRSLDLALPLVDEKAPLPAIIVTPSSPSGEKDFAIAFLAPPPKPSLRERMMARLPSLPALPSIQNRLPSQIQLPTTPAQKDFVNQSSPRKAKARMAIVFAILLFIMACHLIMHSMVNGRPHLEFGLGPDSDVTALNTLVAPHSRSGAVADPNAVDTTGTSSSAWLNLDAIWAPVPITSGKRNAHFIVSAGDEVKENK